MVFDKRVAFAVTVLIGGVAGLLLLVVIGVEFARSLRGRDRSDCLFCVGIFAVVMACEALLAAVFVTLLR